MYIIFKYKTKENFFGLPPKPTPTRKTQSTTCKENEVQISGVCRKIDELNTTCNNNNPNKTTKSQLGVTMINSKIWNPPLQTTGRANPFVDNNCVVANNNSCKAIKNSIPKWNKTLWSTNKLTCVEGNDTNCIEMSDNQPKYNIESNKCISCSDIDKAKPLYVNGQCVIGSDINCGSAYPKSKDIKLIWKDNKCQGLCPDNKTVVDTTNKDIYKTYCSKPVPCTNNLKNGGTYIPLDPKAINNCPIKCPDGSMTTSGMGMCPCEGEQGIDDYYSIFSQTKNDCPYKCPDGTTIATIGTKDKCPIVDWSLPIGKSCATDISCESGNCSSFVCSAAGNCKPEDRKVYQQYFGFGSMWDKIDKTDCCTSKVLATKANSNAVRDNFKIDSLTRQIKPNSDGKLTYNMTGCSRFGVTNVGPGSICASNHDCQDPKTGPKRTCSAYKHGHDGYPTEWIGGAAPQGVNELGHCN
jgi:hypothetical protein